MRVVAGSARGLRLVAPPGDAVRPTTDRVREATFNALGSLGAIEGARVADLFAGSGALGIEALSRGASRCVFVETDPAALRAVRANLATTGVADRAEIVRGEALEVIGGRGGRAEGPFDLVLADPPYGFDRWEELLEGVAATILVIESNRPVDPGPGWSVLRQRTYGTTVVTIVQRRQDTGRPSTDDPPQGKDHT